jgi:hypothetical protein
MDAKTLHQADEIEGTQAMWMRAVLAKYPKARFKGTNAWLDKSNGGLVHVGQYDEYLEVGQVYR